MAFVHPLPGSLQSWKRVCSRRFREPTTAGHVDASLPSSGHRRSAGSRQLLPQPSILQGPTTLFLAKDSCLSRRPFPNLCQRVERATSRPHSTTCHSCISSNKIFGVTPLVKTGSSTLRSPGSKSLLRVRSSNQDGVTAGKDSSSAAQPVNPNGFQGSTALAPKMQGSTPTSVNGLSYYPEGFRNMDKGEKLLTWKSGAALIAVAAVLVWRFQWLATEILLSTAALLSSIAGIMILPPFLVTCLVLHLLTRLPEAMQDKVIDVAAVTWTGATASLDYLSALLDLMPVEPVAFSLALTWLVLTLHENLNPRSRDADLSLVISAGASVGYSLGFFSTAQLLASLAAAGLLSALVSLIPEGFSAAGLFQKAEETSKQERQDLGAHKQEESSLLERIALAATVPIAASLAAVGDNLLIQLAALVLFCGGAAAVLISRHQGSKGAPVSVPEVLSHLKWRAVFQRRQLSAFFLLKAILAFVSVTFLRRAAFHLYLKAHGL